MQLTACLWRGLHAHRADPSTFRPDRDIGNCPARVPALLARFYNVGVELRKQLQITATLHAALTSAWQRCLCRTRHWSALHPWWRPMDGWPLPLANGHQEARRVVQGFVRPISLRPIGTRWDPVAPRAYDVGQCTEAVDCPRAILRAVSRYVSPGGP